MSIKEIKEAIEKGEVYFGIRQTIKNSNQIKTTFIARDTREETVEKLGAANIEFIVLKPKSDIAKELNLDFECEVFSIAKSKAKTKKSTTKKAK
ncbi:MAG: hypothetical protein NUV97_02230 [archaeon]|nr:hypothetical protein [archaeon]MCR4323767.1 hypothetical protein [Nanoarchaeota archaeon]